jgi:hypothetical protein
MLKTGRKPEFLSFLLRISDLFRISNFGFRIFNSSFGHRNSEARPK